MSKFKSITARWLARLGRSRSRATFVCITGSSAKSSTTKMISHILAGQAPVRSQVLTNDFSSCVETLRHIEPAHGYVVCELASGGPGKLQPMIDLVRPSVGVVTLVALEHYSVFRSLEAVAEEKGKLIECLPKSNDPVRRSNRIRRCPSLSNLSRYHCRSRRSFATAWPTLALAVKMIRKPFRA